MMRSLWAIALCSASAIAHADAWLDAGDSALRHDLQYLVDSGVIQLPVTAWPIPSNDVVQALTRVGDRTSFSPGQLEALRRIERRLAVFKRESVRTSAHVSAAAKPTLLRTFENTPREEGEIGATLSAASDRFSARIAVAAVSDPDDDKQLRLDGSYLTTRLGNWLFTAGALDRWWGPGWDGSLLLSNNARPVPGLSLDRESSEAFKSRWLSWIGPWRVNAFMGKMEEHRQDRDHPLLFGMRVSFRPLSQLHIAEFYPFAGFEIAGERTAQWCAEGLPCGLNAFRNVVLGHDNQGENVDPQDEPGNQLAGWSLRWASPFKGLPVAFYRQKIGETIDLHSPLPRRTLKLYGLETWGGLSGGLTWRVHAEFADTACSHVAGQSVPAFDCAYNNTLFNVEGYRYRGRALGHSADGDARLYTLGLQLVSPAAWSGSLLLRRGELNRGGGVPDLRNTVAQEPTKLRNVELALTLPFEKFELRFGTGFDDLTTLSTDRSERAVRGFIEWRQNF